MPGQLQRLKDLWTTQRDRRAWLDHLVRAWTQLSETNGTLLAGAMTFYSFLAIFPLILLGVSVTGFVLNANPHLQTELLNKVSEQIPGEFGKTVSSAIDTAVRNRASVGIIALVTLLLAGLGWINNLRLGIEQVWGHRQLKRSFVQAKLADLGLLIGLGIGLLLSVAITAVGSVLSSTVLRALHLDSAPGIQVLTVLIGVAISVLADMVILGYLLVRLPKADVSRGVAIRGALLAAIGFEILKFIGTYYIARVTSSPTYGAFGATIGLLLWLNLVFRFLLYCTAWTATGMRGRSVAETGRAPLGATPAESGGGPTPSTSAPEPGRLVAWGLVLGALARRRGR